MKQIKFSIPNISKKDINLVGKIIKSGWLTHGKYTSLFEDEICFESFNSDIEFFKITAAAVTGPAKHPLPTSSTPAIITINC